MKSVENQQVQSTGEFDDIFARYLPQSQINTETSIDAGARLPAWKRALLTTAALTTLWAASEFTSTTTFAASSPDTPSSPALGANPDNNQAPIDPDSPENERNISYIPSVLSKRLRAPVEVVPYPPTVCPEQNEGQATVFEDSEGVVGRYDRCNPSISPFAATVQVRPFSGSSMYMPGPGALLGIVAAYAGTLAAPYIERTMVSVYDGVVDTTDGVRSWTAQNAAHALQWITSRFPYGPQYVENPVFPEPQEIQVFNEPWEDADGNVHEETDLQVLWYRPSDQDQGQTYIYPWNILNGRSYYALVQVPASNDGENQTSLTTYALSVEQPASSEFVVRSRPNTFESLKTIAKEGYEYIPPVVGYPEPEHVKNHPKGPYEAQKRINAWRAGWKTWKEGLVGAYNGAPHGPDHCYERDGGGTKMYYWIESFIKKVTGGVKKGILIMARGNGDGPSTAFSDVRLRNGFPDIDIRDDAPLTEVPCPDDIPPPPPDALPATAAELVAAYSE